MSSFRIPFEFLFPIWFLALLALPVLWFSFRKSLAPLPGRVQALLLGVRTLTFCCLVLAATQVNHLRDNSVVFPVFVIDDSSSIGEEASSLASRFVETATEGRPAGSYAVITLSDLGGSTRGSDLQAAVRQAGTVVPEGVVGHVVLLSDGKETQGQLAAVVSRQIVSTVPLPENTQPEVKVASVTAPERVDTGETFSIDAEIRSNTETSVVVDLYADEFRIESRSVSLEPGQNLVSFSHFLDDTARLTVRMTLPFSAGESVSAVDQNPDNNSAGTIVTVDGPTRVLVIDRRPDELRDLKFALQQQQIEVDVVPPAGWPKILADLQKYDTVILSDVSAGESSAGQMELLKTWVRDFGGGLIMLGGENSFGLGGYRGTAIEDVLPVTCDFQEKEEEPGLAMMMVIDKSDSMTGQKIDSARQAAAATVELLTERDQVGVIAFDGSPFWVSDLVSASQQAQVVDRIARIQPGGGTNLYPALQEAFGRLRSASSKLKHVLVLTDGYSVPGDFEGIVQEMAALRMTVSTIGLGAADNELLIKMAETGRGRHYECKDPSQLPQIFARETMRVNQPAVKEDAILVTQTRSAAALKGIRFEDAPFLLGYVVTSARPTSELLLIEPESQDPVLCWWKYGLGKTVAFTSDARNRWATEWLQWEGYSPFWAQLIRFCRPDVSGESLRLDVLQQGPNLTVTIDESAVKGRESVGKTLSVAIIGPDQVTTEAEASAIGPGLYRTTFPAEQPGVYSIQARVQTASGETEAVAMRSLIVDSDDEQDVSPSNVALLQAVASASGGLFSPSPADVFKPIPGKTASSSFPLASVLLIVAMILHVCDVGIRRIALSGSPTHG